MTGQAPGELIHFTSSSEIKDLLWETEDKARLAVEIYPERIHENRTQVVFIYSLEE
jgi:hypothetical protein